MISMCRTVGDSQGNVEFKELPTTNFGNLPARVSRKATLDGGVVITHYGVSAGDRTFNIEAKINAAQKTTLEYLHNCNEALMLSCSEGLFIGAISTMNTAKVPFTMTFLVQEKLA